MGLKIKSLVPRKEISLDDLKDKILAVDSMNILYQFLTTIRQRDGTPLKDGHRHITSHLNGLFYRTTKLMSKGLKLAFVFDGQPPEIKLKTLQARTVRKKEAKEKYLEAKEKGLEKEMKKYASRKATLTTKMVEESKNLLQTLGLPIIQAPSEGEAQAAYLVKQGDAFASISQDFDNLIFGAEKMVRNLSIAGKRKRAGKAGYKTIKPEIISLSETLNHLGIDHEQLIILSILIGTDYNPKGIPGIGPKTALKLVKENKDFDMIFKKVEWSKYFDLDWKEIFYTIKKMPVKKEYQLKWQPIQKGKLLHFLIKEHDFSKKRVKSSLERLKKLEEQKKQTSLDKF